MFKRLFKKKEKIDTKKLDNYIQNKNKKSIIQTQKEYENRSLIYSKEGKQIVRDNKGIIKDLLELSKTKKRKIETKNYIFKKNKKTNNTTQTYFFINKKNSKKYYIKEINYNHFKTNKIIHLLIPIINEEILKLSHLNGIQEYKGLKILNDYNINIIEPKIAYKDNKKTYIMYDFTNLENIKKTKKISKKNKIKIQEKLKNINLKINESLVNKNLEKQVYDLNIKNSFIDFKNKKIYLSDPYISNIGELY